MSPRFRCRSAPVAEKNKKEGRPLAAERPEGCLIVLGDFRDLVFRHAEKFLPVLRIRGAISVLALLSRHPLALSPGRSASCFPGRS